MAEEEYEILPHRLISDLKYDVESLKKKLTEPDIKANELILEIESLKESVHELNLVFGKALENMQEEDLGKVLKMIQDKLEMIGSQNETIARGMIAISDKLEDFMHRQAMIPKRPAVVAGNHTGNNIVSQSIPVKHTVGAPLPAGSSRVAPFPPPSGIMENNLPPPPPPAGKKRVGLFR